MVRRFYNLPPLKALSHFEATARHLSVKKAAAELNVTPGAVSHQLRALEGELGVQLFRRIHRGLELTRDGEALQARLAGAFSGIAEEVDRLRSRGPDLTAAIGASTAVSIHWLAPRLPGFWRDRPGVRVDQHVLETAADHSQPQLDLWIRYVGDAGAEGGEEMFGDLLQPVASPDFLAATGPVTADTLHRFALIRLHRGRCELGRLGDLVSPDRARDAQDLGPALQQLSDRTGSGRGRAGDRHGLAAPDRAHDRIGPAGGAAGAGGAGAGGLSVVLCPGAAAQPDGAGRCGTGSSTVPGPRRARWMKSPQPRSKFFGIEPAPRCAHWSRDTLAPGRCA